MPEGLPGRAHGIRYILLSGGLKLPYDIVNIRRVAVEEGLTGLCVQPAAADQILVDPRAHSIHSA